MKETSTIILSNARTCSVVWLLTIACLAAICQAVAQDTELVPESFEQKLELLKLEQADQQAESEQKAKRRQDWIGLGKWALVGLAAIFSFWLVDLQREKRAATLQANQEDRAATLQTEQLKRSLFENYIDKEDDDNLVLWERKLSKLEAFLSRDDTELHEFVGKEKALIKDLKTAQKQREDAEQEKIRLSENLARTKGELAASEQLTDAAIAELEAERTKLNQELEVVARAAREALDRLEAGGISVEPAKRIELGYTIEPNANLSEADLHDADLRGANLFGADLTRANLDGFWWTDDEKRSIRTIYLANITGIQNAPEGFQEWALDNGAVEPTSREEWFRDKQQAGELHR